MSKNEITSSNQKNTKNFVCRSVSTKIRAHSKNIGPMFTVANLFVWNEPSVDKNIRKAFDTCSKNFNYETHLACLTGNPKSGKSSLLFQYAYMSAKQNKKVIYMCDKTKMQSSPPVFYNGLVPDTAVLDKIEMRYAMDDRDLRYYLANIHCSAELPDLLIIDDLDIVVRDSAKERGAAQSLGRTLAFARDAADYCRAIKKEFLMLVGFTTPENTSRTDILQSWIPMVLSIQGKTPNYKIAINRPGEAGQLNIEYSLTEDSIGDVNMEYVENNL